MRRKTVNTKSQEGSATCSAATARVAIRVVLSSSVSQPARRLLVATMVAIPLVAGLHNGCAKCADAPDEASLPIVSCPPLPAGAEGCKGLPPNHDAGVDSTSYPVGCQVQVADVHGTCGYRTWTCRAESFPDGSAIVLADIWEYPG